MPGGGLSSPQGASSNREIDLAPRPSSFAPCPSNSTRSSGRRSQFLSSSPAAHGGRGCSDFRAPGYDGPRRTLSNSAKTQNLTVRFHNSERAPATMNDEGLADAAAAKEHSGP